MTRHTLRSLAALALCAIALVPALGQDKRDFFKPPETPAEFWRAVNLEINLGKYDLAAEYLKGFLGRNPSDEDLLRIYDEQGASAFLRLIAIPELRPQAKDLITRVDAVIAKQLRDPARIEKLIKDLTAAPEDRAYAIAQLRKSGPFAMPQLLAGLERSLEDSGEHSAILSAIVQLNRDINPALGACLDVDNAVLKLELLEVIRRRNDPSMAPYLWFVAGSPREPEAIRQKAAALLSAYLDIPAAKLPPAKVMLTKEAEAYYQHRIKFLDPENATVWQLQNRQLVPTRVKATQAEEFYGLRFARQALDLDPAYQPAQIVFLSLALEKGFERAGIDQPLGVGAPDVRDLLASVNPDLVTAVLERALAEKRLPVVLGAVRALGDVAEGKAARPQAHGTPALIKALNFPDRRVQLAAVASLLRAPSQSPPIGAARIIEVLRRAIAADAQPRALIADFKKDRADTLAISVQKAGFDPIVALTGKEALLRLKQASDVDVILVDSTVPDPGLPYLLAQLRTDVNVGLLPIIVFAPGDQIDRITRLVGSYPNVTVTQLTVQPDALKELLTKSVTDAIGRPLSDAERNQQRSEALADLLQIAFGNVPGYDIRPTEGAVLKALRTDELAFPAIDVASRLNGREVQRELATFVLNGNRPAPLRARAAQVLAKHVQENGILITPEQSKAIDDVYAGLTDPQLKGSVAMAVGALRPNAIRTGQRLQGYNPPLTPPAPPAAQPGAEPAAKDKEAAKETPKEK